MLFAALGLAVGSSFAEIKWVSTAGVLFGLGILILWATLDAQGFISLFRRKGAKYGASSGAIVALGLAVIVGVAVLSTRTRFNKSVDLSRDRLNTLSEQSLQLAKTVGEQPEKIKMLVFITDDKVMTDFKDLIYLYQASGADFQVEYIDPKTNPQRALAEKIMDGNTVIVRKGAQEKRLTSFTEEKVTNSLINVMKDKVKKIYFTKGHGESQIKNTEAKGLSTLATSLENDKYQLEELSLLEAAKIPEDADGIIVAGPTYDFKEEETRILERYLSGGGSMFLSVPAAVHLPNLAKFAERFGIKINDDLLMLPQELTSLQGFPPFAVALAEFDSLNPITKDFARQSSVVVYAMLARSLEAVPDNPSKLKTSLVAKTLRSTLKIPGIKQPQDIQEGSLQKATEGGGLASLAVSAGKTTHPEMAANEGKKDSLTDANKAEPAKQRETRFVVAGANLAENGLAQYAENRDLIMNVVSYLVQDDGFIAIRPKDPTKSTIQVSTGSALLALYSIVWLYPFLFLGGGTLVWLKRRRA